jgi:hypothetical protein
MDKMDKMDRERKSGRDLFLAEQYMLGELEGLEGAVFAGEIEQLKKSNQEILQDYPVGPMAEAIRRKAGDAGNTGKRGHPLSFDAFTAMRAVPLLAVAALLVAVGFSAFRDGRPATDAVMTERVKGLEPTLNVYRAEGGSVRKMEEQEAALAHDLLQLEYNGAGYSYGAIVSVDGNGVVTLHYPVAASLSTELEPGSVLLPYSYELDDAPKFERFYFVASREPFSADEVIEAARGAATQMTAARRAGAGEELNLSDRFVQTRFTILKEKL